MATTIATKLQDAGFLKQHGLDWDAQKLALTTTGKVLPNLRKDTDPDLQVEPQAVDCAVAIRRSDTKAILGVVSNRYTVCQNRFLVDVVLSSGLADRTRVVDAGALQGGRAAMLLLEAKQLECKAAGEEAQVRLQFLNGHTGQYQLTVKPMLLLGQGGQVPLFTNEKLTRGWSIRHTSGLPAAVKDLSSVWADTVDLSVRAAETIGFLGSRDISQTEMRAVLLAAMSHTIDTSAVDVKRSAARFEENLLAYTSGATPRTLLELADAAAAYVDHGRPVRAGRGSDPMLVRRESAILGTGAKLKSALLTEVLRMLGSR